MTNPERTTMKWAKSLRVEDVARIEQINMTRTPDKQYKDLDAEEFAEIVALINKSVGRYQKEAELLNGRTFSLYITTTDGVRHEASRAARRQRMPIASILKVSVLKTEAVTPLYLRLILKRAGSCRLCLLIAAISIIRLDWIHLKS